MPQIQLIGGELDGMSVPIASVAARPDVFFAVPLLDEPTVRATKGTKARTEVRQKLAILAYTYDKTVRRDKVGWEYQYIRCPEQDRTPTFPDAAQDAS